MKKNILLTLFVYFGFLGAVSAACTVTGGVTTFPSSDHADSGDHTCFAEPDFYQIKIYEMALCTSAPTAPTSASAMVTTGCTVVLSSPTGTSVSVTKGATSGIAGAVTRPANGTYTHGYIRVDKTVIIGDSRQYDVSLDSNHDGTATGVFCATAAGGSVSTSQTCSTSAVTAVNLTSAFNFNDASGVHYAYPTSGTPLAFLVKSDEKLAASTSDVAYLVGTEVFSTPVVVTDSSTTMDVSFRASQALMIDHSSNTGDRLQLGAGPFAATITVN